MLENWIGFGSGACGILRAALTSEFELNFSSSRSCGAFRFETLLTMGVAVCGILMFGWRDGYI
jgi:hypothetical protein